MVDWKVTIKLASIVAKVSEKSFPIGTGTTHIGSSCACSGGQSFWSHLGKCIGQQKAVPVRHPKPIIPLFHAVVTVMTKWFLYIQPMGI